jgi:hypothetical protein
MVWTICTLCPLCYQTCIKPCRTYIHHSNGPVIGHSFTEGRIEISAEGDRSSRYLETAGHRIENFNLQSSAIQNLIRDVSIRNPTDSTQQQLSLNNNSDVRRATTISFEQRTLSSLPVYDDVIRQSSITVTVEQQPSLPPSYDDFMQRVDKTKETRF